MREFKVGDQVIAGETNEEREDGRILEIDGDRLLIAWRQGVRTWTAKDAIYVLDTESGREIPRVECTK